MFDPFVCNKCGKETYGFLHQATCQACRGATTRTRVLRPDPIEEDERVTIEVAEPTKQATLARALGDGR